MISKLLDALQTVGITMALGFVMGLCSFLYRLLKGKEF